MRDDTIRPIPTTTDEQGTHCALTRLSPARNKQRSQCVAPPGIVVPIVFVPGVMGSNLKAETDISDGKKVLFQTGARVWDLDGKLTAADPLELINKRNNNWWNRSGRYRQQVLRHEKLAVDNNGKIAHQNWPMATDAYRTGQKVWQVTPQSYLGLDEARKRGWGSVGWYYYGEFLDWLQQQLNPKHIDLDWRVDRFVQHILALEGTAPAGAQGNPEKLTEQQVKKMLDIQFPVYAVGYNWLQSNMKSGKDLMNGCGTGDAKILGINNIIARENDKQGQSCQQVIVVTHSMGGLVARAAALKHGGENKILGIIHGVQPIDGAAKFYKAIAAGFGGVEGPALGQTAHESTPEIAFNPGPLELAPNKRYNGGRPWLFVKDRQGNEIKLPKQNGDPYEDIYMDTEHVWRAINPEWLDPANLLNDPTIVYKETVKTARNYHDPDYGGIAGQLHPQTYAHWGDDPDYPSWGTLTWAAQLYELSVPIRAASRGQGRRQWIRGQEVIDSDPARWRVNTSVTQIGQARVVTDGAHQTIHMTVDAPTDTGDGTVPAKASGAQIADYGCEVACALSGFDHQGGYNDETVKAVVLDAVVRLVSPVGVNQC